MMKLSKLLLVVSATLTLSSCCAMFGSTLPESRMVWTPTPMAKEDVELVSQRCDLEHNAYFGGDDGKKFGSYDRLWGGEYGVYTPFCGKSPMTKCQKGHNKTPAGIYQACMERAGFVLKIITHKTCTLGGSYGHG